MKRKDMYGKPKQMTKVVLGHLKIIIIKKNMKHCMMSNLNLCCSRTL